MKFTRLLTAAAAVAADPLSHGGHRASNATTSLAPNDPRLNDPAKRSHAGHTPKANIAGYSAPKLMTSTTLSKHSVAQETPSIIVRPTPTTPAKAQSMPPPANFQKPSSVKKSSRSAKQPITTKSNTKFAVRGTGTPNGKASKGQLFEVHLSDGSTKYVFKRDGVDSTPIPVEAQTCPPGQKLRLNFFEGTFQCMDKSTYTGIAIFSAPLAGILAAGLELTTFYIVSVSVYRGISYCLGG